MRGVWISNVWELGALLVLGVAIMATLFGRHARDAWREQFGRGARR